MAPLIIYTLLFLFTLLSSSLLIKSKKPSPPPATTRPPPMMIEIENGRKSDLETVFSSFDSNGDGLITFQELLDSLTRLRLSVTPDDVRSMMEKVDLNEDGLIDVEEFRVVYDSLLLMDGEGSLMRDAFGVFDGDGDGVITVEELGAVLRGMGRTEGVEECRDMIRRVDRDGDGMVSFEEFKEMMAMVKDG